jgi:hypothetical protein
MGISCEETLKQEDVEDFVDYAFEFECEDQFVGYFRFSDSDNLRNLALYDYKTSDNEVVDPNVQIFTSEVFEIWTVCFDPSFEIGCYWATDTGAPLYTGGEQSHLLMPEVCDG